jgi:putative ATPase
MGNFVQQNFLPDDLKGTKIYDPSPNARENEIRKQLQNWWKDWYEY